MIKPKLLLIITIFISFIFCCSFSAQENNQELYADDYDYSNFYGRLYIPDVGIDVALYSGISQSNTDREDSASIFAYIIYIGEIISDHNNQEFSKLPDVVVGTSGYIVLRNGEIINIKCVEITHGYNTGTRIVDKNRCVVMGKSDYLMYTCCNCCDGWQNIFISQWDKYEQ